VGPRSNAGFCINGRVRPAPSPGPQQAARCSRDEVDQRRSSQLGPTFRRQVLVAGSIVDFFAPAARLVIELDGAHHRRKPGADKSRDARLTALGLRVLRLEARLVLTDLPEVIATLTKAVAAGGP
jgi:very-short-patch-repair endonuclease